MLPMQISYEGRSTKKQRANAANPPFWGLRKCSVYDLGVFRGFGAGVKSFGGFRGQRMRGIRLWRGWGVGGAWEGLGGQKMFAFVYTLCKCS